jgi:plasmid stability protein
MASSLAFSAVIAYFAIIDISEERMASITIRRLDDALKSRLRIRAAVHGRSMEDEAREILRSTLSRESPLRGNLAAAIRARFAPLGGVDLPFPEREPLREPPTFD